MMRITVETNSHGIRQELRYFFFGSVGIKNAVIDAWQKILAKPSNRFCRAQNGPPNVALIKAHQRPIALLHFDDAVLDSHESHYCKTQSTRQPGESLLTTSPARAF